MLDQTHLFINLISFFGAGVLLAFTPCVLPMVPILSSILMGQGSISTFRAFKLSLTFVLSMALTYALAGMLAGYLGTTLQTALQLPWVIISFSLIFVLMAFSMFGVINFSMPGLLQNYFHRLSSKQKGGSLFGVAIMGFLSTLIASPCVTAPLVSVLTYISQTGNALLGGLILFSLALGMGLPLLLFGIGQGAILPKAGPWMHKIKMLFGCMMLGLAVWMLSRILSEVVVLFLWSVLLILSAILMGALDFHHEKKLPPLLHGLSLLCLLYGSVLFVGAASGHDKFLSPLSSSQVAIAHDPVKKPDDLFMKVTSLDEMQLKLNLAKKNKRPVMIEFYATWCPACREVDANVLSDLLIQKHMQNFMTIRVDVSNKTDDLMQLMHYFQVYGTPTFIFFDKNGNKFESNEFDYGITTQSLDRVLLKLMG